ncbi:MAG: TIM44-like domain-containing protein [Candidatus Eremiobacteraeota bacterium]|nr:TIM44-like domain-containing protein [Candidatus Eremiobacteraeota bacterium]
MKAGHLGTALVAIIIILSLAVGDGFARGGGGGGGSHSGGGGGSSGSSSTSRSSGGNYNNCNTQGILGMLACTGVLLVICAVVAYTARIFFGIGDYFRKMQLSAALRRLKAKDPLFNEGEFILRAQQVFIDLQLAWSRNDLHPVRNLLSEKEFNRWNDQVLEMKAKGQMNVLEDIQIKGMALHEIILDTAGLDHLKVKIEASMVDKTLDAQGSLVKGSGAATAFSEYWFFARGALARTCPRGSEPPSIACPACAKELKSGTLACPSCGTVVSSLSYGWVLNKILQVSG